MNLKSTNKINKLFRWPAVLGAAMFMLSGCASMNESECITADWYAIGFEDGTQGKSASFIADRRKACAGHGITPDFNDYQLGRAEGVREYCTAANGFSQGRAGRPMNSICPADLAELFSRAYLEGQSLYEAESQLRSVTDSAYRKRNDIQEIEDQIHIAEHDLISDGLHSLQRRNLLRLIKTLNQDLKYADSDLRLLEREQYRHEQGLRNLKESLHYR